MPRACRMLGLALLLVIAPQISAQTQVEPESQASGETVRLFMDCRAVGCFDLDYLRTEIQFVNWVRDVRDADVYLLVTSQGTGAGGSSSELIFTGQGRFEGMTDALAYVSAFDATMDEQREGAARIIKIGLMRFVGLTAMAEEIDIGLRRGGFGQTGPPAARAVTAPEDDPWDFWVFRIRGSGGLTGRTNYESRRFSGSLSANRTTEEWKTSLSLSSSYNETRYDYPEIDYHRVNIRRSLTLSGALVKSIAPKWSAGLNLSARNATYYNFDFAGSIAPVLEYSVFPYEEATRRSLTFQYAVEGVYHDYREQTVYFKDRDSFLSHRLAAGLNFTRPWGSAYTIVSGGHHLEDVDLHNLSVFGGLSLRLGWGVTLTLSGNASRVQDLVSIAADAGATIEEILLSRRQLQIDYRYSTSISLSYSFGSIFNNVVNPRLGGVGMGGPFLIF